MGGREGRRGSVQGAYHRGETTTRGNVIRRPRHDAAHTPAFPTQNSRIGALSGWAGSDPGQGPSIKVGRASCECGSVNTTVGGIQKAAVRLAMTARGSVGSSHCAHGTRPHIFERHQPTDTVATYNHFRHVWGAKVRMPCCSEATAQQLSQSNTGKSAAWRRGEIRPSFATVYRAYSGRQSHTTSKI